MENELLIKIEKLAQRFEIGVTELYEILVHGQFYSGILDLVFLLISVVGGFLILRSVYREFKDEELGFLTFGSILFMLLIIVVNVIAKPIASSIFLPEFYVLKGLLGL